MASRTAFFNINMNELKIIPFDMVKPLGELIQRFGNPDKLVSLLTLLLVREHHQPEDIADRNVNTSFFFVVVASVEQESPEAFLLGLLLLHRGLLLLLLQLFLRLLDGDLASSPRDDVQVRDGVDGEQQVHGGNAEQVHQARHDAPELLRMEQGRYEERSREGDQEDRRGRAETVLTELKGRSDDDGHHDERVRSGEDARE